MMQPILHRPWWSLVRCWLLAGAWIALLHPAAPAQQSDALDSLMTLLYPAKGSARLDILNQLPRLLLQDHPEQALAYIREAESLSRLQGDLAAKSMVKFNYGHYHYTMGDIDSALVYHRAALRMRQRLTGKKKDQLLAQSLNGIGAAFDDGGYGDSAFSYYTQALTYADRAGNLEVQSSALANIGTNLFDRHEHRTAIGYFKRGLEIDQQRGDDTELTCTMSNLGMAYLRLSLFDSALYYHQEALRIRREHNNMMEVARSLNNIGQVYREMDNRNEAAEYFLQSLEIKRGVGNAYEVARTLNNLGKLYNEMGRYDHAFAYLREAKGIVDTLQAQPVRYATYQALAQASAGQGQYALAFAYQITSDSIEDQIHNAEREATAQELRAKYESAEKEKQIVALESQTMMADLAAARTRQWLYLVVGGFAIVVLLGATIFFALLLKNSKNRRLEALNRVLAERNAEIAGKNKEIHQQSLLLAARNAEIHGINTDLERMVAERTAKLAQINAELDLFLYQSSHALRGPLMRVAGLSAILKGDPAQFGALMLFDKLDYTVRGMDRMLHKLMDAAELHSRDLVASQVDLRQAITSTLADIEALSPYPECEVRTDLQIRTATLRDRFAFDAVLRNILENALHFRQRGRAHVIEVQAERHGELLFLRIRDNGIGIPPGELAKLGNMFHRASAQSAGMGLGLYVLRLALERVGGRFEVRSEEGLWTEVRVEMPLVERVGVGLGAGVGVVG